MLPSMLPPHSPGGGGGGGAHAHAQSQYVAERVALLLLMQPKDAWVTAPEWTVRVCAAARMHARTHACLPACTLLLSRHGHMASVTQHRWLLVVYGCLWSMA